MLIGDCTLVIDMTVFLRVRSVKLRRCSQSAARAYLDQRCEDETGHNSGKRKGDDEKCVWVYTQPNVTVKFLDLTGRPLCDGFFKRPANKNPALLRDGHPAY
jgi:hypothetical protein